MKLIKKIILGVILILAISGVMWAQNTIINNGTTSFALVSSNGGTVFTGSGEIYLSMFNAGSNTILWAFGTNNVSTNIITGSVTNTVQIGETLNPGSIKVFDKNSWNATDNITAKTTNSANGSLIFNKGY